MKKSILFLTNAYPDFEDSYRGIFIKKMAELLKGDGYDISVVTPKIYTDSRYFEEKDGIKIYRFPFFARGKLLIEYEKIPYLKMIFYYISGVLLTIFVMFKHKCRLIHVHWAIPTGVIGILAGRLLRKPLVVTIHGSDFRMATENSNFLKKIFLWVCRGAKQINCVSELQVKGLEKMGVEGEKISTIPMGVEQAFLEAGKNREMKSASRPFTVLSNRNLLPIYNVSLLIRAIPMVVKEQPSTMFLIAGDGPEREHLEREARNFDVSPFVQFLGRVPHEKMPNLLSEADIYVSTSLYDGTSVSLLEAMGSGAFPIVTNVPANREWINDGENGFLISVDDEKILAQRIIESIKNRSLLEKSVKKNLLINEKNVLWPAIIEKIGKMYHRALDSGIP